LLLWLKVELKINKFLKHHRLHRYRGVGYVTVGIECDSKPMCRDDN